MDRGIIEAQLRQLVASAEATKAAAEALLRELSATETEPEIDPTPVVVPEPTPPRIPEPTPPVEPEPAPPRIPEPTPPRIPEPQPPAPGRDEAAERLVAMKMALDGATLTEVNDVLDDRFGSALRSKLIFDVFERAGR
jgi:outer membrane biosynthesis protein TonB